MAHCFFLLPSIVCVSCGYPSPCSATGRPGGWISRSPTAWPVQCRSRTNTQVRYLCPWKTAIFLCCANLAPAHAAHNVTDPTVHGWHCFLYPDQISEQQQRNKGKKENQVSSFRGSPGNNERTDGITEVTVAGLQGHCLEFWVPLQPPPGGPDCGRNSSGCATNSDSSLSPASCHSFSSSSDLATAEASLQQRARSSQSPASFCAPTTLPPKRSLHLPRDRGSTHTLSTTPGGVPGLGNRGGDGDLASCLSGESGRIPSPLCSFLEFVGEFKRAPTSFPVGQQLSRCDGRREGLVDLAGRFGKKTQTVGVLAPPMTIALGKASWLVMKCQHETLQWGRT